MEVDFNLAKILWDEGREYAHKLIEWKAKALADVVQVKEGRAQGVTRIDEMPKLKEPLTLSMTLEETEDLLKLQNLFVGSRRLWSTVKSMSSKPF